MACVCLLMVILVPLPTSVLDLLLVINITLSVIVLVTTIYVKSPLEFAVFPSLLLALTLFPFGWGEAQYVPRMLAFWRPGRRGDER